MSIFGCAEDVTRDCQECVTDEPNRIIHVAFVKKGTAINTAALATSLQQAEKACNAFIVRNTNGTYDGGTAQQGKGQGRQPQRMLSKRHIATITDFAYIDNYEFWKNMEVGATGYDLYFFTENKGWVVTGVSLTIEAKMPITDNNETFIESAVSIQWSQRENPKPYDATTTSLDECQDLFLQSALAGFENMSGGSVVAITGSLLNQLAAETGDTFSILIDTDEDLSSATLTSGTLPTGLVLSVLGTDVRIIGSASETGTFDITIKVVNACGIAGYIDATITIS